MPAPVGRPSKYDPRYCQEMIDFCREGFSLTGFAGSIGVSRDTLTEWADVHPDFSLAIKDSKAARTFGLEKDAARVRKNGAGPGTATLIIFGLKNFAPDEYADKITQDTNLKVSAADEQFGSLIKALDDAGRAKAGDT